MKKLKMQSGDRMNIFYHPDDLMSCKLIKSTSAAGYIAKYEAKSNDKIRIAFMWKRPVFINEMDMTKAEYIHLPDKNMILFRIEQ